MNSPAHVSVVVPCYRCTATIGRAVASVAAQTLRPAELILVDDASGDETLQQLYNLQSQYGQWINVLALTTNAGAASARNAGWNRAKQPYIAFLDGDDAWHPKKIEIQYTYMEQHSDVALSAHQCRQLPSDTLDAPEWALDWVGESQEISWSKLLLRHQFVTPSVMLRRKMNLRFLEGARYMEDYRLWLETAAVPLRIVKLQIDLAAVYKPVYGASGLSADMWSMERAELANFWHFYRSGKLSLIQLILLHGYSLAKFTRRLLIMHFQGRT